jgi:hypothetical protein
VVAFASVSLIASSSASAAEILLDGGFEAATGNPLNSPSWVEADSAVGSPLCENGICSTGGGTAPPRTGLIWAWFGGVGGPHTGSLAQTVTIPVGTATLTYYFRNGAVALPLTATLLVKVDGVTVETIPEAATAETSYSLHTVDMSAYADDAPHTLTFDYNNPDLGVTNMTVDDVSLDSIPSPPAPGPTPAAPDTTAPETTITKKPTKKHRRRSIIRFESSEPGATFTCIIDSDGHSCTSPENLRNLDPGRHVFQVAATDPAGNTDTSPATTQFFVRNQR